MRRLNFEVDVERHDPAVVVREWLDAEPVIGSYQTSTITLPRRRRASSGQCTVSMAVGSTDAVNKSSTIARRGRLDTVGGIRSCSLHLHEPSCFQPVLLSAVCFSIGIERSRGCHREAREVPPVPATFGKAVRRSLGVPWRQGAARRAGGRFRPVLAR